MARKRDEERVAEAARLLASGATRSNIAAQIGVDRHTLSRWLGPSRPARPPHDDAILREAVALYESGRTSQEVSAEFAGRGIAVDPGTVTRWAVGRKRGPRLNAVTDATILYLRERRGLSYREMAALTGMSVTGVRNRYWAITGRVRADRQPEQA